MEIGSASRSICVNFVTRLTGVLDLLQASLVTYS